MTAAIIAIAQSSSLSVGTLTENQTTPVVGSLLSPDLCRTWCIQNSEFALALLTFSQSYHSSLFPNDVSNVTRALYRAIYSESLTILPQPDLQMGYVD